MVKGNKFGTFGGVFTPSILTILGVIMYLRLPMIVGTAGLWGALGIIIVAHIISFTTGLSVSSIATDKKVEAGGTYYMISRSLGLPIGGTLGLALFVGLSFSVSLYLIGFAESFLGYWGFDTSINSIRLAGTIALVAVTTITLISTSLAIKTQYIIMAAIGLSLLSIVFGKHEFVPQLSSVIEKPGTAVPFMLLFGIFFPAVTGFEAGVSMSGDLKDPKRSIPKGAIMAIVIGLAVYIALAVFLSTTVSSDMLATDPQVLLKISWVPALVIAGIWGATMSSALGSILGAPRILQATALDKITPKFLAKGTGATNEPRNALLLTFVIAEAGILIGELDVIARIVSIFFITTYGFLNLSCALEKWTSADFRPSFKTPIWVSFLGAAACFIVMIELDFIATLGAVVILGGLFLFLKKKELSLQSGDTWAGVWSSLIKTSLQKLTRTNQHTRNWRPNIIMFNGADHARPFMLNIGNALAGKFGMLSSFELIQTENQTLNKPQIFKDNKNQNGKNFHYTYECADVYSGINDLSRFHGFAGLEPNTVLMGWSIKSENKSNFIQLITRLRQYNLNALFLHHPPETKLPKSPVIDIWWSGWGNNLALGLSILRHLSYTDIWSRSQIRICIIVDASADSERVSRFVKNALTQYRIAAEVKIIESHNKQQNKTEIISKESASADLAIIGLPDSSYDDLENTYNFACSLCKHLSSILFINASNTFEEHTVIHPENAQTEIQKQEWVLPVIEESKYTEINSDISKIDEHGLALVDRLYNKIFVKHLELEVTVYNKMNALSSDIISALEGLQLTLPEQRQNVILRAKKLFLIQMIQFVGRTEKQFKEEHEQDIHEGIQWYIDQLEKDVALFPKQKPIKYKREEFKLTKGEPTGDRWFKIKMRMLHPFSSATISLSANYREGAAYFFRDSRYHFLTVLLADLEVKLHTSREDLHLFLLWVDESFKKIINAQTDEEQNQLIQNFCEQIKPKSEAFIDFSNTLQSLYKGRLQVEHRKNLIYFIHQLERIDFNRSLHHKTRTVKFYHAKKESLVAYPEKLAARTSLDLTTTSASLILYNHADIVIDHIKTYTDQLKQFLVTEQESIIRLTEELKLVSNTPADGNKTVLPELMFNYLTPFEAFEDSAEKLRSLTGSLPDEIIVASKPDDDGEPLKLSLRAMVSYLTETSLTGPVNDTLEESLDKIRRSHLIIKDLASYAMFTVFNMKGPEDGPNQQQELKRTLDGVAREQNELVKISDSLLSSIETQGYAFKTSLRLGNLVDLSDSFSTLVRSQRKKTFGNIFKNKVEEAGEKIKEIIVSLLYSRTKGTLLARQLSATEKLTLNEHVINAVTNATPNQQIVQQLPHFYVTLFSGQSNIGDNFWVTRPHEEKQLELAYQRYQRNGQGIMLMLGERNSGKTALCKRFSNSKSSNYNPIHIFPPENGSVSTKDFDSALSKATKLKGNAKRTLSLLPRNRIVVIHDLEMWWERSESEGLTVINYINTLFEEFSSKFLFIVNMNPFAFDVINVAESIERHCVGVIRCQAFNSFELRQLIMTRHQASGLSLDFGSGVLENVNEIKLAGIFNRLFNYSDGNPGVAMNAWLTGINHYSDQTIMWSSPPRTNEDIVDIMPDAWSHLALQLLIHKRMTLDKMIRSVQLEKEQLEDAVNVMTRLQLIKKRGQSVYHLNPAIEFLFVKNFRKKEWIS